MKPDPRRSGPWIGIGGLVVVLWFYLTTALVAPWWVVVLLVVLWLVMLVVSIRWAKRRPLVVLAMPVLAIAVWFGVVSGGGAWLGWSA